MRLSHHGTRSRYKQGCRCDSCTAANTLYQAGWRRAKPRHVGTLLERLMARTVIDENGCYVWTGSRTPEGYGRIMDEQHAGLVYTHRAHYELAGGTIPAGWHVDHLCRNPPCHNPTHLEAVTPKENVRRAPTHSGATTTHCKNGHAWAEDSYISARGRKICRMCDRVRNAASKAKRTRSTTSSAA